MGFVLKVEMRSEIINGTLGGFERELAHGCQKSND